MHRVVTIACLLLLTVGSAAAWAGVCCPQEHEMTMQSSDECLAPAARTAPSRDDLDDAGATAASVVSPEATVTPAHWRGMRFLCCSGIPPGNVSPAATQTTPILLL